MTDEKNTHHCHDNCDCEENIIVLEDEEGNDHEFNIIDMLEIDGNRYAILMPINDEFDEAIILKIEADENGEEFLFEIEDDDEWEAVARAWEELLEEEGLE